MAKIHTHYDNLKVSRMAPPEVIRAAYKALSQKYHPDKNPGDEKAARIMAILNSAYNTLSDQQRRREHDEWIAAEEWEIEWLESTGSEESKGKERDDNGRSSATSALRNPRIWLLSVICLSLGWLGSLAMQSSPKLLPDAFSRLFSFELTPESKPENKTDASKSIAAVDGWVAAKPTAVEVPDTRPETRIIAVSQIRLPDSVEGCEADTPARPPLAPNGEPWPVRSGYLDGYKTDNFGGYTQITLDNSGNAADVFAKLFDVEKNQNVRQVFVLAREKFLIDKLTTGNYELRYQALPMSAQDRINCTMRKLTQTSAK